MKKYFFKEDGTIRVLNMIIIISIIFIIALVLIYNKFLKREYEDVSDAYVTSERTSSINMCKDCDFYFTLESLTFSAYSEYNISNYIETKNMALNNIKFRDYDSDLINIESKASGLFIKAKDKIGTTKLVAEYSGIVREINIEVVADSIKSVSLEDHPYYILNGKSNKLNVITEPLGIPLNDLDIKVEDTNTAKVVDGKLVGLKEGITKLVLNFNGKQTSRELYVFDNLIHIEQIDNDNKLSDVYKIKLSELKNNMYNVIVTLDDNHNYGYSTSDLIITHEDDGLEVIIDYDGKYSLDKLSYRYRITVTGEKGSSVIKFNLGTSVRILEIGE